MNVAEGRRRQKHYAAHRRRWRTKHPVATSNTNHTDPVPIPKVEISMLDTGSVLASIVASYRDDPVTGWGKK